MAEETSVATETAETETVSSSAQVARDRLARLTGDPGPTDDTAAVKPDEGAADQGGAKGDEGTEANAGEPGTKPAGAIEGQGALSPRQLGAAKELGYSEAEIAELGPESGPALERAQLKLRQQISRQGEKAARLRQASGGQETEGSEGGNGQPFVPLAELTDDDLLGETHLERMNAVIRLINEIVPELEAGRQERAEQDGAEEERVIDQFFAGQVGEDGKPLFEEYGTEPAAKLDDDDEKMAARVLLVKEARKLERGYQAIGEEVSFADCLDRALSIVGRDTIKRAAQEEVRRTVAARRAAAVPRPGGRRANQEPDTESGRATKAFEALAKRTGVVIPP